jgi:hypothetical protein
MPYRQDPYYASMLWGRIGSAILILTATVLQGFNFAFDFETQEVLFNHISLVLYNGGGILAVLSKIRESKKVEEADLEL